MAWSTPRTWVQSELVTPGLMNTEVRDNFNFLGLLPAARAHNDGSATSTATSTWTQLGWSRAEFETDGTMLDSAVSTTEIVIPTTGYYMLGCTVAFAAHATGFRQVAFTNNTGTVTREDYSTVTALSVGTAADTRINAIYVDNLAATTKVGVQGWQDSGGSLSVTLWAFWAVMLTRQAL